jgi:predicted XRE-type DNA-binding protein
MGNMSKDVFKDLGFSDEEAEVLRLKTDLHIQIMRAIKKQKLTPHDLEEVLRVPQPRVSELLGGKIYNMTTDRLVKYLYRLGCKVRLTARVG